jgi:hypothetical protein
MVRVFDGVESGVQMLADIGGVLAESGARRASRTIHLVPH